MQKTIIPIILAGGSGTRLWPLSRTQYPKQFLKLLDDQHSMLQSTMVRAKSCSSFPPIIVCNEEHRFLVAEQLRSGNLSHSGILLEPVGRNTAPAIALAAEHAKTLAEDPILLVLSADHFVECNDSFADAVSKAVESVLDGNLATFGIRPHRAETGYGYIKASLNTSSGVARVEEFVEKPSVKVAEAYVASGNYFWNSGIFCFSANCYLAELKRFTPRIAECVAEAYSQACSDLDFLRVGGDAFANCPSDSIDYAVMERTEHAVMVPLETRWSDVGSFTSLAELRDEDHDGNVLEGRVTAINTSNNVVTSSKRLVGLLGVKDTIVVDTDDALLIMAKSEVNSLKTLVAKLAEEQAPEISEHRRVSRPWGSYEQLDVAEGFKVKRISVRAGEKLSLQSHKFRAEHWVVVRGTAKVTNGDETYLVQQNESTFIPLGTKHRLENPGTEVLELIEVQSGDYLGEDDIERYSDDYGR